MKPSSFAIPCALFLGLTACSQTPSPDAPSDLAAKQRDERTDQRADQKADRIDLGSDQNKETVDARADAQRDRIDQGADAEKDRIDKRADRSKFDAEFKARLEKVDARIADANGKFPSMKAATRPKANESMKSVREQRATLGDSYRNLGSVTDQYWAPTKTQIETSMTTLEHDVAQLETLVAG